MVVIKLFRHPQNAVAALASLRGAGFSEEAIGLLAKEGAFLRYFPTRDEATSLHLPGVGECRVAGPLAGAMGGEEPLKALAGLGNLPQETLGYYELGLTTGGILVTVHGDGDRLEEARRILRSSDSLPPREGESPGFRQASAMTETDPLDAKMTGDFRRY